MPEQEETNCVKVLVSIPQQEMQRIKELTCIETSATALLAAARKGKWFMEKCDTLATNALSSAEPNK